MKNLIAVLAFTLFLTACEKDKSAETVDQTSETQVYESTSETSISTTVDAELDMINQPGTSNEEGL
jgi:PBP1b-binding outer membrane lipoprotein LpoB